MSMSRRWAFVWELVWLFVAKFVLFVLFLAVTTLKRLRSHFWWLKVVVIFEAKISLPFIGISFCWTMWFYEFQPIRKSISARFVFSTNSNLQKTKQLKQQQVMHFPHLDILLTWSATPVWIPKMERLFSGSTEQKRILLGGIEVK